MIFSFVLLFLFQNIITLFFNSDPKVFNVSLTFIGLSLFNLHFSLHQLIIIIVSLINLVLFFLFLNKTKKGIEIRAINSDRHLAELRGIDTNKIIGFTSIISSLLAALAGILITLEQNIEPSMGLIMIFKGITASIIGGNKIHGAVLGAFIIGIVENLSVWYFPSGYKNLVTFVLLIIFVFVRPKGLFGSVLREEVSG